ncbi:hypothetical protein MAPG_04308 [Magnaporthiopsis poae ATCC 64411]|uniref:Uncharacterized protein n=1 Tax=Magnaporthiopsis poae (strain ATCC 64411 / 73-15) TaxID=644358 RepID=A0A0C4DWD2_MAGP6|nr:hypothetical protein MAPG_04308 [Magnaporthiopsis poae ATCC 64411]
MLEFRNFGKAASHWARKAAFAVNSIGRASHVLFLCSWPPGFALKSKPWIPTSTRYAHTSRCLGSTSTQSAGAIFPFPDIAARRWGGRHASGWLMKRGGAAAVVLVVGFVLLSLLWDWGKKTDSSGNNRKNGLAGLPPCLSRLASWNGSACWKSLDPGSASAWSEPGSQTLPRFGPQQAARKSSFFFPERI